MALAGTALAGPRVTVAPPKTVVPLRVGRLAWTAFDERAGLPANTVIDLALGPDGRLWAGTQEGAAFYDGRGWEALPMPATMGSAYVRALLPTADGSLWFGTFDGGIARLSPGGEWSVYDVGSGLPSNRVRYLLEVPDGSEAGLWAATDRGVARLRDGRWTTFDARVGLPSDQTDALLEIREMGGGSALLVGTDAGIGRFRGGAWSRIEVPPQFLGSRILGLTQTSAGALWASTYGAGMGRLENGEWLVLDTSSGLPSNAGANLVSHTAADGTPVVWAGFDGGAVRYEHGRFTLFDHRSGIPSEIVWKVLELPSAEGPTQFWAGSYGGGVFRLDRNGWRSYDQREGLPAGVVLAFVETGAGGKAPVLWAGTAEGRLARLGEDGWVEVPLPARLRSMSVTSLLESRGPDGAPELWVASQGGGVARRSKGRWKLYDRRDGLPHDRVDHMLETRDQNGRRVLWFATEGGLGRLDAKGWTTLTTPDGLPADWTTRLLETRAPDGKRTLWVGTAGGGVARFDGERWTSYGKAQGLRSDAVWSLREVTDAEGVHWLWVGTWGGGASRLRLDDPARWQTFSDATRPALPSRTVNDIQQDREGRVYLFTTGGAVRLTPRTPTPDDPSPFDAYTFTTEDGLPSNDCQAGASLVDHLGRIWVGTARGVGVYDVGREVADRTPKPLRIARATVAGNPTPLRDGAVLSHTERNFSFDFSLLSYSRESKSRYRVQLVGFDPEPSAWSAQRSKEYTNLEPGAYAFRVWGRDYARNVSGPVSLSFRIRPAPWRTGWAYAAYLLLASLLAWGTLRLRVRAITRTNRQLEAKVAERTAELAASEQRAQAASRAKSTFLANMSHELRTPLNAVLGFAQIMSRRPRRDTEDRRHLDLILRSGEHLLGLIDEVLSLARIEAGGAALRPAPFDLPAMLRALIDLLRPRAEAKGLSLRLEPSGALPDAVLGDAGKLRQILLNLVGNAVKFTAAGSVTLRATAAEGRACFEVEDTGPGFQAEELADLFEPFVQTASGRQTREGTGLGLALSRELAKMMDGDLTVTSRPGRGSVFRLEVALPPAPAREERQPATAVLRVAPGQPAWRVLVVDNVESNREVLSALLRSAGHDVREAADGRQAIEEWRSWRPHLIWMDRRMPGLDGIEAMRRIRAGADGQGTPPVVIVAHSASALEHQRGEVLESGFDDFVAKPLRAEAVFDVMTRHLGVRYEDATGAPATVSGPDLAPTPAAPDDTRLRGRALLVDDHPINREIGRCLLEEIGLTVVEARDGREAISQLATQAFDVVLLDVEMPGMDGVETVRAIRADERTRDLPVLALTAHTDPEERERLLAAGMSDHLPKPIDLDGLRRALGRWLDRTASSHPEDDGDR